MQRLYLSVSPEEYPEVKACGAEWDDMSKRWYLAEETPQEPFARWLNQERNTVEFGIASDDAMVLATQIRCAHCGASTEVICIFCDHGVDVETDQALAKITVSNIRAMDAALRKQLERWPSFKKEISADSEDTSFANRCSTCDCIQQDYLMHSEPGDVFFDVSEAPPGSILSTPLAGRIQLSGDYAFEL